MFVVAEAIALPTAVIVDRLAAEIRLVSDDNALDAFVDAVFAAVCAEDAFVNAVEAFVDAVLEVDVTAAAAVLTFETLLPVDDPPANA